MIKFKDFRLQLEAQENNIGTDEVNSVKDYLDNFTKLDVTSIYTKNSKLIIIVNSDIDSSMSDINKALDGIGYEIDNADNKDNTVKYTCIPLS